MTTASRSRTTAAPVRYASIDEALGARATRFFGEGFKRVAHRVTEIEVNPPQAGPDVTGIASLAMPGTWSRKGGTDQRPHLSTVDAMVVAARLTGLHAAHAEQVPADGTFRVRSLSIKAGSAPDEDDLDGFPVTGTQVPAGDGGTAGRSAMRCAIGAMAVEVTAEHSGGDGRRTAAGSYDDESALPGPWLDAPFGVSHHSRSQHLHDVEVDCGELTASARLDLTTWTADDPDDPDGAPTMIDLFVSALQLGQALLYELDGVPRARSNTLWMRSTRIAPVATTRTADARFRTTLARTILLPTERGTWRSARIVAVLGGYELSCDVSHLLPPDRGGPAPRQE